MAKGIELGLLIVLVALLTVSLAVFTGSFNSGQITSLQVTQTPHPTAAATSCPIVINEFMAKNTQTIQSPEGNYSDWIELYNRDETPYDVSGMFLTDNFTDYKWQFTTDTVIPGHAFLLVWADNNFQAGPLHTNFKLNDNNDKLALFSKDGVLVDSVVFDDQIEDISYGRTKDGGANWNFLLNPTPEQSNTSVSSLFTLYPWHMWVIIGSIAAVIVAVFVWSEKRFAGEQNKVTQEKQVVLRHELKFEVDPLEYLVLQKNLCKCLKPDPYMPKGKPYNVRSLYFDDFHDTALVDKEAGEFRRRKYRLRIYNHSDSYIKFERKNKIGVYMLKESTRVNREEAERLIFKDYTFLAQTENPLLRDFYMETRCNSMRPVVIVEYEREAYINPIGNVRVTFDTQLRMSLGGIDLFNKNLCMLSTLKQQNIILEVKYNQVIPSYIRGLFPDTIKPKLAIGKFVICRNQQIEQKGVN